MDGLTPIVYLMISAIPGTILGAIPLVLGAVKREPRKGFLGLIACAIGGLAYGLLLAVPFTGIFTAWVYVSARAREQTATRKNYL